MERRDILGDQMEKARQKLCDLGQQYGLTHSVVLKQSMVLDELINQYNGICYRHAKSRPLASNRLVCEELLPSHSHFYCNTSTLEKEQQHA